MNKTQYKLELTKDIRALEGELETKRMLVKCITQNEGLTEYETNFIIDIMQELYFEQDEDTKEMIDEIQLKLRGMQK